MTYALISVFLNALAQLTLKKSITFSTGTLLDLIKNPYLYVTGFCYMTSIVTWFLALSRIQLSIAYPLQALGYLAVTVAAVLIFNEKVNTINWFGLLLILCGVVMTQIDRQL